jgi:hypothetical protein
MVDWRYAKVSHTELHRNVINGSFTIYQHYMSNSRINH